ncbi:MAG: carbohydrate ABC transporter permease [Geminicoccaceae bacterium]
MSRPSWRWSSARPPPTRCRAGSSGARSRWACGSSPPAWRRPSLFTIPFFLAYRFLGLNDTIPGLVLIYLTFNLALVIWMMQTFFATVPKSLEEAAWIDGCSVWGAFLRITLPLTAPGLAATAVLCFIFSWNDFFYALILTRTNAQTAPVAIVNFIQYEGWEWGKIAAGGTLVMMPVVVFTMLVRTYLVRGLTAGGIKD